MQSDALPGAAELKAAPDPQRRGAIAALRYRDFRVLLFSTMALQIGSWVQSIGQGWLVFEVLNGSAGQLALVALLRGGSMLVVAPFGGYLASKYERRRQLIWYTGASASIAALLAVLIATDQIAIWMIYVTAAAAGIVEALAGPIRNLLVYDSVDQKHLTNAVALNSLGGSAMRVIGPAIGGALIAFVGVEGTFALQAACLALSLGLTFMLRRSMPELSDGKEGLFRSIAEGMKYVVRDRRMLTIVGMGVLPSLLVYPYLTFLPIFASEVLGAGASAYGSLAAAVGLGSLAGGVFAAGWNPNRRMGPGMIWTCMLYSLAIGAFSQAPNLILALVALTIAGVFYSVYAALQASLMQLQVEPEFRGRVMSLQTMTWGITPFSALVMGFFIDQWSAPPVVLIFMLVAAGMMLAIGLFSREMRRV